MNKEILTHYFTDQQQAVIQGITLGGLRNKIYRQKTDELPPFTALNSRTRLWHKQETRTWLLARFNNDKRVVDDLMRKGEKASPGASFAGAGRKRAARKS